MVKDFCQANRCWCAVVVGYHVSPLVLGRFSVFLLVMGRDGALYARDCILVWEYRPSGKLSILSFTVFVMLFSYSPLCAQGQSELCNSFLSIMWKGRGSFLKHLVLILSLSLIVTTLGKLILLSLKVTLTSFQSISRVL